MIKQEDLPAKEVFDALRCRLKHPNVLKLLGAWENMLVLDPQILGPWRKSGQFYRQQGVKSNPFTGKSRVE